MQTGTDAARALGVQWGVNGRMATELGNTAPVAFPAQSALSGRTDGTQGNPMGPARSTVADGGEPAGHGRDLGARHLDGHAQRRPSTSTSR